MSLDVIRIPPDQIRYKLDRVDDLVAPIWPGDWDVERRSLLNETDKHRAVVQRYQEGMKWEHTDLFKNVYRVRFAQGETVHGCTTMNALAAQYYTRMDALYDSLRRHGFQERVDGALVPLPQVYVARDSEVILSNQGNHRIAMAKVLGLPSVLVQVVTRHPLAPKTVGRPVTIHPVLHAGADDIPAMTTPSERFAAYEMAKSCSPRGAVLEWGAWLGATTVYLAAGVRDSESGGHVHVYDRFVWHPSHTQKAGGGLSVPVIDQFATNLGPLSHHVAVHQGEILQAAWLNGPIAAVFSDGPKRLREIAHVLSVFGPYFVEGSMMAWQDFAHFASYDIPACLDRLEKAGFVSFWRGVYPGTTAIFRVERPLCIDRTVNIDLRSWTAHEIESTWDRWEERLPHGQQPRFSCGAALFLCDIGATARGAERFKRILMAHREDIEAKWLSVRASRPTFVERYPALDALI